MQRQSHRVLNKTLGRDSGDPFLGIIGDLVVEVDVGHDLDVDGASSLGMSNDPGVTVMEFSCF